MCSASAAQISVQRSELLMQVLTWAGWMCCVLQYQVKRRVVLGEGNPVQQQSEHGHMATICPPPAGDYLGKNPLQITSFARGKLQAKL